MAHRPSPPELTTRTAARKTILLQQRVTIAQQSGDLWDYSPLVRLPGDACDASGALGTSAVHYEERQTDKVPIDATTPGEAELSCHSFLSVFSAVVLLQLARKIAW